MLFWTKPPLALQYRKPIQAMKDWQKQRPDLLKKRVSNCPGLGFPKERLGPRANYRVFKHGIAATHEKDGKTSAKKADTMNSELASAGVYGKLDQKWVHSSFHRTCMNNPAGR